MKTLYIDMDNVLVDFNTHHKKSPLSIDGDEFVKDLN